VTTSADPSPQRHSKRLFEAVATWHRPHTGLSAAERFVVRFTDGSSAFVQRAMDPEAEIELRAEYRLLTAVTGSFVPTVLAWADAPDTPTLITEDLSAGHWPADQQPVRWDPAIFHSSRSMLGFVGPRRGLKRDPTAASPCHNSAVGS
jgi:hypothetical protein